VCMCEFSVLDASATISTPFWSLFMNLELKFFCDLALILVAFISVVCLFLYIFFCFLIY